MALKEAENRPLESAQIRELETSELKEEIERLKEAQFRLKFRSATETIDNPLQFRTMRRNIARMNKNLLLLEKGELPELDWQEEISHMLPRPTNALTAFRDYPDANPI